MKKLSRIVTATIVVAMLGSVAMAAPKAPKSKAPTCPMCKMTLSKKKDKTHTVAVKIKKSTYYCCAACGCTPKAKKGK